MDESLESKEGEKDGIETIGAVDQGMVFGFATNEIPKYLPLSIELARKLSKRLAEARKNRVIQ